MNEEELVGAIRERAANPATRTDYADRISTGVPPSLWRRMVVLRDVILKDAVTGRPRTVQFVAETTREPYLPQDRRPQ